MSKAGDALRALTPEQIARFKRHVDVRGDDDCWPWLGAAQASGRGHFYVTTKRPLLAPRVAYVAATGHQLSDGECVLHRCDNPNCVNPNHLFIGTIADNVADCKAKGRQARGERNTKAKLTEHSVSQMRKLRSLGYTMIDIAKLFDVSRTSVGDVCRRHTWKHVA